LACCTDEHTEREHSPSEGLKSVLKSAIQFKGASSDSFIDLEGDEIKEVLGESEANGKSANSVEMGFVEMGEKDCKEVK